MRKPTAGPFAGQKSGPNGAPPGPPATRLVESVAVIANGADTADPTFAPPTITMAFSVSPLLGLAILRSPNIATPASGPVDAVWPCPMTWPEPKDCSTSDTPTPGIGNPARSRTRTFTAGTIGW